MIDDYVAKFNDVYACVLCLLRYGSQSGKSLGCGPLRLPGVRSRYVSGFTFIECIDTTVLSGKL